MNSEYSYCKLVRITVDAYSSCMNHALLTDSEEVMGLLLGNVEHKDTGMIINIFSTLCLSRKCKEKDRVEFDEIQVSKASEIADQIEKEHKINSNVVGWYHSHPKITIPPSGVDLNTQFSQQYQGPFIGLIISCFNTNNGVNKINLTAFQTKRDSNGMNSPIYVDIDFIHENEILPDFTSNTSNTASTYSSIMKNILIEEEEQFNKELITIEKTDYLNNIILLSNRQTLFSRIIQSVSQPYVNSVNTEIENMRNYLVHAKELNSNLRKIIRKYEEINKLKDQDNE
jgi:BRCA1/BRCA2-containing complex subunit 3